MKRHWIVTLASLGLLCCTLQSAAFAQLPDNYQRLAAEEKRELLWSEIIKSHDEEPLPQLTGTGFKEVLDKLRGLFNLSPTFDHASDELPEGRVKILHPNGSVAKVAFVAAANHPFTGMYQTGGIGLARLSLGTLPTDDSYIPGMAIKFLISNSPSVNLQVMNALEGQNSNWNFFAKEFSNKIEHPTSWTLKAIEAIFSWTHDPANELPLRHLAAWTTEGKYKGIPIYPERIFFKPTELVQQVIPEHSRDDFRISLFQVPLGAIYEVYGEYRGDEYHIGTLMLESYLIASNYGDKHLFFQHQR